jgi:hypothetical protein
MLVRMLKKITYILLYFLKKMKNMLQENQPWRINDAQSTMVKKANM